ncbi:MAG: amidohydrolase [Candidatus Caldarchaeum sp.]|uniref:Amidohydrolase n=1 Tax=Caldiarchaeum subterraneum TaxID=311458 RepID=A0A7C5QCZ5_CALS0
MSRYLIKGGFVIPVDGRRRIIRDGCVLVADDRVEMVGSWEQLRPYMAGAEVVDAHGCVIIPGLVDTHVHLAQALLRGVVPDNLTLIPWLRDWVWRLQGAYDSEDAKASAALCILEMLKTGTTAFVEIHLHTRYGFNGIAELVEKSGIRGVLAKSVMDMQGYATSENILHPGMVEDREACIREFKEMHRRWHGKADGRIQVWLGLRSAGAVSDRLYHETAALAQEYDTGITNHIAEVREDIEYYRKAFGTGVAGFLERFNMLGERHIYAHCVWLDEEDIRKFADTGTTVSHCPSSNMKLGSGIAPVSEMLRHGVNVTLGCDGGPSNDTYDMIREMKTAALLQKARTLNPNAISAWDVLEMATRNGARAIGRLNQLGSLEPGKKADIVVVSLKRPSVTPVSNPLSLLVYAASGEDVRDVMINGRFVVRNKQALTLEEEQVLRDANKHLERILVKADIKTDLLQTI